jgi:hypothetical protein
VSFFASDPAPEPPEPPEYRPPAWSGPPENELPATVALDVLLARSDDLAVWLSDALVYRKGALIGWVIARRTPSMEARGHPLVFGPPARDGPRFGVGFADGRKAVLGDHRRPFGGDPATGPVLTPQGGGGSQRYWQGRVWLWPVPPEGPLTLAFAWDEADIGETVVTIDSLPLARAAERAIELWPDDRPAAPRYQGASPG